MSGEGLINVEDDGPDAGAVSVAASGETPPVVAADQASAAPPEQADHPAEVNVVDVGGQKMVPAGVLAELISERRQRQALSEKAARVDELEAYARDSKPYVEFLKANPGLISQRNQPAQPQAPAAPTSDPESEQLAKTLDLYTPEGKPDVARAATIRQMMTTTAQQIAQQTIAPMREESDQTKSARNYQVALGMKDAQGNTPSPQALQTIWRQMTPAQTADPHVASILALTAMGLDRVNQKAPPAAPTSAPLVTEGQGQSPRRPSLSKLEQNVARERGISESQWAKNIEGFVSGRAQNLED
jgi:hypothetical protein